MMYKQIFFYSIPVYSAIDILLRKFLNEDIIEFHVLDPYAASFLATWLIGTISFMVSLLGSCSSIDVDKFEQDDFKS